MIPIAVRNTSQHFIRFTIALSGSGRNDDALLVTIGSKKESPKDYYGQNCVEVDLEPNTDWNNIGELQPHARPNWRIDDRIEELKEVLAKLKAENLLELTTGDELMQGLPEKDSSKPDVKKPIEIRVYRQHNNHYWIEDKDLAKLAPNVEPDSSIKIKLIQVEDSPKAENPTGDK